MPAHPRSRGENENGVVRFKRGVGSSPLTRGKRRVTLIDRSVIGLIPAHAGKTTCRRRLKSSAWAHPRSRGENTKSSVLSALDSGSSPLTRGKPCATEMKLSRVGLIPAHAGKTRRPPTTRTRTWAHPRSRGENAKGAGNALLGAGSSPLTRGKRAGGLVVHLGGRLIPAHAGKTQGLAPGVQAGTAHPRSRGENGVAEGFAAGFEGSSPLTRGKLAGQRPRSL